MEKQRNKRDWMKKKKRETRPRVTEGKLRFKTSTRCIEDPLFLITAELIA